MSEMDIDAKGVEYPKGTPNSKSIILFQFQKVEKAHMKTYKPSAMNVMLKKAIALIFFLDN